MTDYIDYRCTTFACYVELTIRAWSPDTQVSGLRILICQRTMQRPNMKSGRRSVSNFKTSVPTDVNMFSVNFRVTPSEGLVYFRLTECMESDK